ncbi:hypothetical protein MFRU_010g03090 [Monilinia fructicola]|nr:hypothetical protein MFRU_010g03090 [Monilinia fructicola]
MASPNTSRTRRVLGDININISTSAFDIDHALSIAKIPKVSESGRPLRNSPDLSKWVGNSTSEVQQENREKDKKLQVGSIEGEVEEEISSKGSEKESKDARISTAVCSSNAGLAQLAGRKRGLSASGDVPEFSETHIRPGSGKKQKTEIQQSLVNAPSTDNFPPCNDMIQGEQEWRETCSRAQEHAPGCDYASIAPLAALQPKAQIMPSTVSLVSATSPSSSVEKTEEIATVPNSPQASETAMPEDSRLIPTTVSTTRSFRTSKSKSLSREEIRQKSQALRLRLSLANYKVKTNQIDLPLSRLEVRPTSPTPPLARLRTNPSYGASMGSRTPLPGAPTSNDRSAVIPAINLQRPSPSRGRVRVFNGDREKGRNQDADIPSSPPSSRSDSLSRRDSAISCTSLGSNSGPAAGHAHPLSARDDETHRDLEINVEREVARRKQDMMRGREAANLAARKPILERQKLGILHPPMMFAQPDSGPERSDRGRSPELSRKAADGLLRLSLLR